VGVGEWKGKGKRMDDCSTNKNKNKTKQKKGNSCLHVPAGKGREGLKGFKTFAQQVQATDQGSRKDALSFVYLSIGTMIYLELMMGKERVVKQSVFVFLPTYHGADHQKLLEGNAVPSFVVFVHQGP